MGEQTKSPAPGVGRGVPGPEITKM